MLFIVGLSVGMVISAVKLIPTVITKFTVFGHQPRQLGMEICALVLVPARQTIFALFLHDTIL